MIDAFRKLIDDLTGVQPAPETGEDDVQLAVGALLFHVMAIDGEIGAEEQASLKSALAQRFDLDDEATGKLVAKAGQADAEAIDLYGFTSVLKQRMDVEEREKVVGLMWQIVFADGELHEFEDNLVWRVAELLGVSGNARIRLKQAARDHAG